ncbi:inositol monophosphatase family protein [Enemella evansiae]|uniref:inositol monophosphatase family protein n=1 Tax=Enemella evansiae TaxID=2016499 RepID=UPI001E4F9459|nr:inositol monophosphatase [Enemella evansiae]
MAMTTDAVLELIKETAEQVIRPRWRALSSGDIAEKNPGDFVTVADQESEVLLTEALQRAYPDALIVGEEATAADPSLVDGLCRAEHAFVVDPVDGTRNFVEGTADYAVMIGEVRAGEIVRGWIWQPEHDAAWVAERGAGTWRNGERVTRRTPDPQLLRAETSMRSLRRSATPPQIAELAWTAFSCGIDYPRLCAGGNDVLVYRAIKPWDHIPGALLVRELDGVARLINGQDYQGQTEGGPLVVGVDEPAWQVGAEWVAGAR